ncbi:hypothetical protein MNBD_GAMMA13-725 [hydrothermal vent metagenome]|uniref:Ancillary SecYEG translocon subunit n=1 Tax=hydrothermal vent metagenome TaxID=652676 RepID=A0A3B0Y901_9ZZZZ
MDVHASEKEQVEALKTWWKDNGSSVITGILLGLSVLLGGKAWFGYQDSQKLNASNVYAQMMAVSASGDSEQVKSFANVLITEYTSSIYAQLSALLLARQAVDADELPTAQAQLEWALDKATTPEIEHAARTRLIRVMIGQAQYAQAESLLDTIQSTGAYQPVYSELKGDLAVAQGEFTKAAAAYKAALSESSAQLPNIRLLSAKYESVSAAGDVE